MLWRKIVKSSLNIPNTYCILFQQLFVQLQLRRIEVTAMNYFVKDLGLIMSFSLDVYYEKCFYKDFILILYLYILYFLYLYILYLFYFNFIHFLDL